MQLKALSRRWLIAGGVGLGLVLLVVLGLRVVYPRVGAHIIRGKLAEKIGKRLGRDVRVGSIDVALGHAVLRNLEIRGKLDGDTPLVHIDRVDVDFDAWGSLVGSVKLGEAKIKNVMITVRRDQYGRDNVRDIVDTLRAEKKGSGKSSSTRPTKITVDGIRVLADDATTGLTALVDGGDATWTPGLTVAHLRGASATTPAAPKASVASIEIKKASGAPPTVTVQGGELTVWERMSLTGITGTIIPSRDGKFVLDFSGGYGGVPGKLWTAKGGFDSDGNGAVDLVAEKFQLDRLAPILASSAVVDYQATSVDAQLHVSVDQKAAKFDGDMNLSGLNVGHPMIADKEVHDLDMSVKIAGSYDRETRSLELTRGDFVTRNLPFSITGTIVRPRRDPVVPELVKDTDGKMIPTRGPYDIQLAKLRVVIPPIKCQGVLDAIPAEMAPYMQGYKAKGTFDADVRLEIDWTDLDAVVLGGHIGINRCKIVDEPADSPKRLQEPFEHYVEVEKGEWLSFIVGPENPDFVPIADISPNLIKSILTTEDGAFYKHHGFIVSEFRTALVSDLKARAFRHGASSITMQMVKNVLLYREKTLARKLQELFLTWHVENTLDKDRILEIYFNVIEYGPSLYGIGPAARHYFGKAAKDLTPKEAAFFSSILPNPKDRYRQYCQGSLFKWTEAKVDRILLLMLKRERITQEEYDKAMATPLVFVKDGSETEKECMERVKKAIKNARPTTPPKKE